MAWAASPGELDLVGVGLDPASSSKRGDLEQPREVAREG